MGGVKWNKYKVGEVFDILNSKKKFDANKVSVSKAGYPYVVRTSLNNGIKGRIDEDIKYLNPENSISFGQDTATMFYQSKPYFTGDKIKVLASRYSKFSKLHAMFLISGMRKAFSRFTWGSSSFSVNMINTQEIMLPVTNEQNIDYEFMSRLILAVQKCVIQDLIKWTDRKIELTKPIIIG